MNGDISAGGTMTSMSTLIGDNKVQIYLHGDDLKKLKTTADDICAKINDLDSIEEAFSEAAETSHQGSRSPSTSKRQRLKGSP